MYFQTLFTVGHSCIIKLIFMLNIYHVHKTHILLKGTEHEERRPVILICS